MSDTPDPASPPCYAHDLPPSAQAVDWPQWRKAQREALLSARQAIPAEERGRVAAEVAGVLDRLIAPDPGQIISLYWPFKAELDLRFWMESAQARGARIALPLVEAKGRPLRFREWLPGCAMERGIWNILQPSGTVGITPTIVIAPLVGFDPDAFRLGYGGGFFDRTLALLGPGVKAVGVGHPSAALRTIHPQPHDIAMNAIVTGARGVILNGW